MRPIRITKDSTTASIYYVKADGTYTVCWREEGERKRRNCRRLEDAKAEATRIIDHLVAGRPTLEPMSVDDIRELEACRALIAKTKLPLIAFIRDAMRGWNDKFEKKRVKDVVKAYQQSNADRSGKFIDDIRWRLDAFGVDFGNQFIDTVSGTAVREWIDQRTFKGKAVSARTKSNYLKMLRGLWRFGQRRNWIPKGTHELSDLDGWKHDPAAYSVMPQAEISHLLTRCNEHLGRDQLVPYLAVQAWGGLRAAEAGRLAWEDIIVRNGKVVSLVVAANKAKTKARRVVEATPALAAMLHEWAVLRRMDGPIRKWRKLPLILHRLHTAPFEQEFGPELMSGRAEFDPDSNVGRYEWRHNQLRHTFATHLLREWGSADKVAVYLGTSPSMLDSHYLELTTPEETKAWMAMRPDWKMPRAQPGSKAKDQKPVDHDQPF